MITSLLIKQDLCYLPNLQEYLKTENKATGKVFKGSQSFLELRNLAGEGNTVEPLLTLYKPQYRHTNSLD